jgi:ATP-binding cassette subfamily C protein/ATP-binding cassette subfamily C protein EexD
MSITFDNRAVSTGSSPIGRTIALTGTTGRHSMTQRLSLLAGCRSSFAAALGFSVVTNLLALAVPIHSMQVYDRVMTSGSLETLAFLTVITLATLIFLGWLEIVRARILQRIGTWLERRLSAECLRRSLANPTDSYGTQALRDLAQIRQVIGGTVTTALMDAPWSPVYLAALWILHPLLATVALGGAVTLFGLAFINEMLTRRPIATSNDHSVVALRLAEAAHRGRETAEPMGMSAALISRWVARNDAILRLQQDAGDLGGILLACSRTCRLGLQVLLLGTGAYLAIEHQVTAGVIMASSILMARALSPIEQAIGSWRSLVVARSAADRLTAHLKRPELRPRGMRLPVPQGHLSVERISHAAAGRPAILKNVSFELQAGEALTIVGPSGAGKSTLARLLIGASPALSGRVRLDGADVFMWDREDFGRHVGYLPQQVDLFDGTIAENIARMGEPRPEDVVEAAQLVGIHDMVLRLPDGYQTCIGTDSVQLSGGQRQRIALARAVYGNPRLVVLDEPNSNLDGHGEEALVQTINALKRRGTTVVAVSHRPGLVRASDRLLVLRDGAVEIIGPRDEVLTHLTRTRTAVQAAS